MTTDTAPRPEKVAIVEEITAKLNNSVGGVRHRVPRACRSARSPTCAPRCARPAPSTRCTRTPWPASPPTDAGLDGLDEHARRPDRPHVRRRRLGRRPPRRCAICAKTNPLLVSRAACSATSPMTADDVKALADLPSREELLARFAGAFQAPLVKTAGLLQALPAQLRLRPLGPHRDRRRRRLTATRTERARSPQRREPTNSASEPTSQNATRRTPTWQPRKRSSTPSRMTVIELKELLDAFEEKFGVTAAAPVAVAAPPPPVAVARRRRGGEGRVRRRPHRRRRPEDPGHQGRARASPAWASRRPRTSSTPPPSRPREGHQGRRRGRQGQARRRRRHRRAQVSPALTRPHRTSPASGSAGRRPVAAGGPAFAHRYG